MGSVREYETVFVLHPGLEESGVEQEIDGVRKTIEAGSGEIVAVDRWGKRKL
ncbi:MAG: 30S ribosomal protein S6, partial [Candidatus Eisenbacteria bacterium]|nr:30S ribosomal protein S6 [Candidatus Latescibacterota bacterium]MBD3301086.1 30S ribosomal protein S6 [Candidatus Eisenbacteria bacterium]